MSTFASLLVQLNALKGDMDKVKGRMKAEAKEREALSELVAVHSEVFVDVQKKLEGHAQVRAWGA